MRSMAFAAALTLAASSAHASETAKIPKQNWSFGGIFGTFDRAQLQRGFTVYKNVCSACHGMNLIAYRNLTEIGFSEDEVKAIAAEYEVTDGPNDEGEMFQRPARPSDRLRKPFANENAARAANNGAAPPDLSLMIKAREDGANYVYALLTGYAEPPADMKMADAMSFNKHFPGGQIAMAPPISEGAVEYADGTSATVEQISRDVVAFLAWAAEPEMEARKRLGVKVILFLLVLTGMLYAVKRKVWADVH
ncbi:MAG: cytochrome c1 [Alphaproteobacteria bacterium]